MQLHEMMEQQVLTVSANDYAAAALELMRERAQSRALVLDRQEIVGVVFRPSLEQMPEAALRENDVRQCMLTNLTIVSPDLPPEEAEKLLRHGTSSCLVIAEDDKKILAALCLDDLIRSNGERSKQGAT